MAQIGTIGLETQNSGTVKVPVFDTGDSGSSVYEFVRCQTASGVGFIPVVDPADATFPYLRVQSQNHGVVAVHDSVNLIPDSNIYLHDDWGDNKLTNRDDSGTTTYNGVQGVYRPDWSVLSGLTSASVANTELTVVGGEGVSAGINLDLSKTITWEWTDVDVSSGGAQAQDNTLLYLFSDQISSVSGIGIHNSYYVKVRNGNDSRIGKVDGSGTSADFLTGGTALTGTHNVTVTRSSGGTWELFIDGTSQGTATDTDHTAPSYIAFAARDSGNADVNEFKVF